MKKRMLVFLVTVAVAVIATASTSYSEQYIFSLDNLGLNETIAYSMCEMRQKDEEK